MRLAPLGNNSSTSTSNQRPVLGLALVEEPRPRRAGSAEAPHPGDVPQT